MTLQEVLDSLEASLPPSAGRKPFKVDSDYYWISQLEHTNKPGKVNNAAAAMHMKIERAFKYIQQVLLLHQGQAIDEAEVDLMSL